MPIESRFSLLLFRMFVVLAPLSGGAQNVSSGDGLTMLHNLEAVGGSNRVAPGSENRVPLSTRMSIGDTVKSGDEKLNSIYFKKHQFVPASKEAPKREPSFRPAMRGGDWGSSGGGSGIACFDDIRWAWEASKSIRKGDPLSDPVFAHMTELTTLDFWEWRSKGNGSVGVDRDKKTEDYLNEVQGKLVKLVPLFLMRMQQAAELTEFAQWQKQTKIDRIFDTKEVRGLAKNCVQVQLAARYTLEKYKLGEGPSKFVPTVKIVFNPLLYARLDSLNRAILIVHEQLYLLGLMTGYQKSDEIRSVVMLFFSDKLNDASVNGPVGGVSGVGIENQRVNLQTWLKSLLVRTFGDYINYFGEEFKYEASVYSQESRLTSYYQMINRLRFEIDQCNKRQRERSSQRMGISQTAQNTCRDLVMNPQNFADWMTDEMAFVFFSSYFLDMQMHIINVEFLLAPFAMDSSLNMIAKKNIKVACEQLEKDLDKMTLPELAQKSIRYCRDIKPVLFPMEINRN